MKAPTSLLILPPELLINPLLPSFLHIPPLHFFTLTLLYPYTSLPLHSFNSFNPVNSFKRFVRLSRASISCVHLVRPSRSSVSCVHLVRPSRASISCVHLVRPSRASVSCVSSASSILFVCLVRLSRLSCLCYAVRLFPASIFCPRCSTLCVCVSSALLCNPPTLL